MNYINIMDFLDFDFKNTTLDYLTNKKNKIIQEQNRVYNEVANFQGTYNYITVILPMDSVDDYCNIQKNCISFISNFGVSEDLRNHATDIETELEKHNIELAMRKDIYDIFNNYYNNFYQTEKNYLSEEQNKSIEDTMISYKRLGMHLPDDERNIIKEIKEKITEKQNEYMKNLNNDNSSLSFKKSELKGLPNTWFESHQPEEETRDNEHVYKVTIKPHDLISVIDNCDYRDTRKEISKLNAFQCNDVNSPLFNDILNLRALLANKLGFKTFAEYNVQENILNTSEKIIDFENNLINIFESQYKTDIENLTNFAKENGFKEDKLQSWDLRYYDRLYKEKNSNLNMEEVRKYFSLDNTISKMFIIFQNILGLSFIQIQNDNIWHDSVKFFQVIDRNTLELVGYFYLDLFPREGKYSHFAIFDLCDGFNTMKNQYFNCDSVPSVGCMACNFPEGEPLKFDDVVTLFHEFGHMVHLLCCKSKLSHNGSFRVKIDFVETPSQLLEYWCYSPQVLKFMTRHCDTNEPMSEDLINKLLYSEKLNKSIFYIRQIFFGLVDMNVHNLSVEETENIDSGKIYNSLYKKVTGFEPFEESNQFSCFGHMCGYEAGYYSYLRSEAYSANLYYRAFEGHEFDEQVGMRYRKTILEPGSSKNELEIMKDFLQEDLDDSHFIKELSPETNLNKKIEIKYNTELDYVV